jgi:hypothetical protein
LAQSNGPRFERLLQRYKEQLNDHVHSQSIHVHRMQLVLQAALHLLDTDDSADADSSEARAMRLLAVIRVRTEQKGEPIFIAELAETARLAQDEAKAAWRYLRDHRLIDTFSLEYTARINARGIDMLCLSAGVSSSSVLPDHLMAMRPEALDRRELPEVPSDLLTVLQNLWHLSVTSGQRVDAPIYSRSWSVDGTSLATGTCTG